MVATVSSAAYTETVDGVTNIYTWSWSGGLSSVRSQYSASATSSPFMRITANMFNLNVKQNNGVDAGSLTRYESIDVSKSGQNKITLYASMPGGNLNKQILEEPVVWLTSATSTQDFSTSSDFSFTIDVSTLDYYNHSTLEGILSFYYVDDCRIRLMNDGSVVYTLTPTFTSVNSVDTSVVGLELFSYSITFTLENSDNSLIEFDKILFDFPCAVNLKPNIDGVTYYSRYFISISNPELVTVPSDEVIEGLLIANASNDDLISKLGTVNTVDQARINAQSSAYSEVATVTGGLAGMTDFSESLRGDVNLSQDVDVLSNDYVIDSVSDMWDIFPWESQFFTVALGMVGSIALLSLVLHGADRGISLSISRSSSNNNRRNNRNNSDNKKGSG